MQRDNCSHCSEIFPDINIVLKFQLIFTIVIFIFNTDVDEQRFPGEDENNKSFFSGMVFPTAADDGGPVRECDVSHYVFQIVNVKNC